jgi:hypothetical protein
MSAANAANLRERVTFRQHQTVTATLDGPGVEQAGREGPEYRYMLDGHRIMWVPPAVHEQIWRALGSNREQAYPATFEITKTKPGNPWLVVHVADEGPDANGYGAASPTQQRGNLNQPPPPAAMEPAAAAARPAPTPAPRAAIASAQAPLPDTDHTPYSASMYTALCAAIRTAQAAEKFGAEIGRPVAFETSDIRTIAATLFIHATGGR